MITSMLETLKKKTFTFFSAHFFGQKKYFFIFRKLFLLSLKGMNFIPKNDNTSESLSHFFKSNSEKQPMLIFDIGAGSGASSDFLLNHLDPKGSLVALEPSTHSFTQLAHLFQGNPQVSCHQIALGDKETTHPLFHHADLFQEEKSTMFEKQLYTDLKTTESVQVTTLDRFCHDHKISQIELLYLDCNGAELSILQGAKDMLKHKRIHRILFSFGRSHIGSGSEFNELVQILYEFDIKLLLKDGQIELLRQDIPFHDIRIGKRLYIATLK